jgi:integrase
MYTGCRRQEACKLKWEDVNFKTGALTFRDTKNGTDHHFPIGDHLLSVLKERWLLREMIGFFQQPRCLHHGICMQQK